MFLCLLKFSKSFFNSNLLQGLEHKTIKHKVFGAAMLLVCFLLVIFGSIMFFDYKMLISYFSYPQK